MNSDLRDSIYLWLGGVAVFGILWIGSQLNILERLSDAWFIGIVGILGAIDLTRIVRGLWQRRASKSQSADGD